MEEEFVTFEQAVALKELGFNEPCFGWWFVDEVMLIIEKSKKSTSENIIQAPTYSQAFRFFREKYKLEGVVQRAENKGWYKFHIYELYENCKVLISVELEKISFENAELECLRKLIKIEKNK